MDRDYFPEAFGKDKSIGIRSIAVRGFDIWYAVPAASATRSKTELSCSLISMTVTAGLSDCLSLESGKVSNHEVRVWKDRAEQYGCLGGSTGHFAGTHFGSG